ncbi:Aldose 1-/Glucose-6-phosphate 1-epimerase [Corchorus olitorius]|uniref:Aldose 1-epimerase n=1 Tax=Corchorus olitorius TaxID=93759 RepID=A0A1R3GAV5_9ROSI|nr:Aldose 1-/Glucose-6-phosphate 1-epimerase [Corchorus olitorius]
MAKKISILFSLLLIVAFAIANGSATKEMVELYELKLGNMTVKLTNWGATIVSVILPDKYGKLGDIALGYDSVREYMNDTSYVGSIVGRFANRIAGAQFTLNGVHYKLVPNEGKNMLHGFPGDVKLYVSYTLLYGNRLAVKMKAEALNKATPVNLAQHTYWNLGNHNSGNILSQQVQIFASHYTPVDSEHIPTGEFECVEGTPYDFLQPHTVGSRIYKLPNGYDINYVLDGDLGKMKKVAVVKDNKSGRVMELSTNQPGVQFYTANFLKNVKGKGGYVYQPHGALCLETQGFPDAVNHPNFPSTIIYPGKDYKHVMMFTFSISP